MTNTFHTSKDNLTNINNTDDEIQLLKKNLKCSLHYKHQNWTISFVIEKFLTIIPT